jgi:polyhydroxybutyrate depolymerase
MDSLSEASRFLVAYPNGTTGGGLFPSDWNAGTCCGAAARENVDDVGFISALVSHVSKNLPVDARRVYVAGFSNGGRMAYHAACRLAPMIAAIGVVSGSLKDDQCTPARAVAVIAIHGTSDDQVPYADSALTRPPLVVTGLAASLPSSVQFWVATDGCNTGFVSRASAHVVRTSFRPACAGAEVVFYAIEGGVHAWPGDPGGSGSQPPMSELAASTVLAQFLGRQFRR